MAGWWFQTGGCPRVLAVALGMACWTSAPAGAQDASLVYEKEFNLSVNPTAMSGERELMMPMEPMSLDRGSPLSLPSLIPTLEPTGERTARIIQGEPAKAGAWRSAVNIRYGIAGPDGKDRASFCGASLIDESWVLTAAHCVFRVSTGGLRDLRWVTAYADDVHIQKGKVLRVKAVHVLKQYDEEWIVNDLALLHLETRTTLPRQKLAGGKPFEVMPAGTMASIVGWGQTKGSDPGSASPVLLQARIPVLSKAECDAFRQGGWKKGGRPIGDADFCAGYGPERPPVTCNGDSGGPLYVASASGEPIQAGVVSWGIRGCTSYAAYASVGHFEPWIRKHVPKAVFVTPGAGVTTAGAGTAGGPREVLAGVTAGGPPSPHGQCAIEVYADGVATNTAKVGAELSMRLVSGASGRLAVFSATSASKVVQLFPSNYTGVGAPTAVQAGATVDIPGQSFTLKVSPPLGRHAVVAIIMPEGSGLSGVAQRYADMAPIEGFGSVLAKLADEAQTLPPGSARAVCTRQFDVVE